MPRKKVIKVEVPTGVADDPGTPDVDESVSEEEVEVEEVEVAEGDATPVEDPDSPLDPEKFIAVDTGGQGTYEVHPIPAGYRPFARTILIHGRTFEHVADHRGVWAYRHLG